MVEDILKGILLLFLEDILNESCLFLEKYILIEPFFFFLEKVPITTLLPLGKR